jgi:hypothetical protein
VSIDEGQQVLWDPDVTLALDDFAKEEDQFRIK